MAKNRFATKALNPKDEPILVTLELNISNMNIEIKSFPILTTPDNEIDEFIRKFTAEEPVDFPESTTVENRSFTEESLLPDHIKVDGKSGAIRQLQNEWSYLLLNAKLFEQFNTELDELKQKAADLKGFSHELFDEAKEFWEKVLEYKKEREISQEKLTFFKEEINGVFDHLKYLKESMLKEKDELTEKVKLEISEALTLIDSKLEEQGIHFKTVMDDLKALQVKLRSEDVKRDIKNILFDNIQASFEKLKSKRDEVLGAGNNARVEGLNKVLDRLLKTLDLDKRDLDYNTKKLNSVNNKLELQLREAKINVLKDRIMSKEEKVADIQKTLKKLVGKKSIPTPNTEDSNEKNTTNPVVEENVQIVDETSVESEVAVDNNMEVATESSEMSSEPENQG